MIISACGRRRAGVAAIRNNLDGCKAGCLASAYLQNVITAIRCVIQGTIKYIAFTYAQYDKGNEITVDVGTFTTDVWTGSAESVTFTIGGTSGHRRIASITVVYA